MAELAGRDVLMTSVCTGSLVYADAGLLDGEVRRYIQYGPAPPL